MGFTIPPGEVIPYEPAHLRTFKVYGFEWIDNLHFLVDPATFLGKRAEAYIDAAAALFREAGWAGDGEIQLLWLPPFVFPLGLEIPPQGVVLWHVKQDDDGVSFILAPFELPFEEFESGATSV